MTGRTFWAYCRGSAGTATLVLLGGCMTAQASAVASNGPLHGVARIVVMTPLAKAPAAPSFCARLPGFSNLEPAFFSRPPTRSL